jgi:ADP-ribose pyrophosphatase YjhB (NUDIX family)
MDHKFSRQAARIINAPYFYQGKGLERIRQKVYLRDQLIKSESFADLPQNAKTIVRLAVRSLRAASAKLSVDNSEEETDTSLLYGEPEVGTIASAMMDTAKEPKGKTTRVGRDVKKRLPKGRHRTLFKRLRVKKRWLRSVSLAVDDEGDGADRLQLIAEILVLLFKDKAEEETKKLLGDVDISAALAMLATPKVTRRYGKQPGPGWTRGGTSRKGQQIWIYGASTGGAAAAPTPTAPTAPPVSAPTPSAPAPPPAPSTAGSPAPPLRAGGQQARASSIAAYNDAMKKLTPNPSLGYPGRQLTTPEKASLAKKLTNMPISMLRSLHTALGGTGATGNMKATVTAVKSLLTGTPAAAASPTPSPAPAPSPTPTTPAPTPTTPAPTPTTPAPTPAAPSPTGTPGTRPIDKLAPALQPHAANIRAIALAYLDNFISHSEAMSAISAETRQLSNLGLAEVANAMGVRAGSSASTYAYISAVVRADPGHPVTSNPYIPLPSPPGPPPRPGLVWNPTTHRWILAPASTPTPTPSPAPTPFAKARRTPLGTPSVTPSGPVPPETIFTTGTPQPGTLNGVAFSSAPPKFWEKVKDVDIKEPPPARHIDRASVMIQEPDGRIWIVKPTNDYGGRGHTFPGGGVEPGLTDQQNALKEVWEETGLQVEITGHLGDFKDSNTGKNGRLYIGRRVGGAPWDAKIESHIIDQKTGKPAAESETVVLATPEHALKLLKRTDDLAQLMTVNPIPIDTAVEGTGSEPLKKLVDALEPARKAYEGQKKAKGQTKTGNAYLHTIQDMRGLNEKPKVISKSDMDKLIAQGGHIEMMRGLKDAGYGRGAQTAKEMAEEFKRGDHFSGYGIFGSGTYADATKGHNNVCTQYAGYGGSGAIIRMALPKTAKIITFAELEKKVPKAPELFKNNGYEAGGSGSVTECWRGVQAALAGYDAIVQDGNSVSHRHYGTNFHIILNRSILVVQEEDAAGHRIK